MLRPKAPGAYCSDCDSMLRDGNFCPDCRVRQPASRIYHHGSPQKTTTNGVRPANEQSGDWKKVFGG